MRWLNGRARTGHTPREKAGAPSAALRLPRGRRRTTSSCICALASSGKAAYQDKSNGTSTVATFSNRRTGPKASDSRSMAPTVSWTPMNTFVMPAVSKAGTYAVYNCDRAWVELLKSLWCGFLAVPSAISRRAIGRKKAVEPMRESSGVSASRYYQIKFKKTVGIAHDPFWQSRVIAPNAQLANFGGWTMPNFLRK